MTHLFGHHAIWTVRFGKNDLEDTQKYTNYKWTKSNHFLIWITTLFSSIVSFMKFEAIAKLNCYWNEIQTSDPFDKSQKFGRVKFGQVKSQHWGINWKKIEFSN